MIKKVAYTLLAAVAVTAGANAQLLSYDVNGTASGASPAATLGDPNITATGLIRSSTLTISAANNAFASTNWNNTSTTADFTQKYIDFTVSPTNGGMLNLTSLQYAINGSNTAPNQGQWAYSLDGGNTFTPQGAFTITFAGPTALATWDFADFSTNSTVDFRFVSYGTTAINSASASANTGSVRIFNIPSSNDLILNGTFSAGGAVPEPKTGAFVIGAMTLFGLVIFRRSRAA